LAGIYPQCCLAAAAAMRLAACLLVWVDLLFVMGVNDGPSRPLSTRT